MGEMGRLVKWHGNVLGKVLKTKKFLCWSYLGAHGADQLGLELALEEINNEGIVPHLVPLPCLVCNHLHQHTAEMFRKTLKGVHNPRSKSKKSL